MEQKMKKIVLFLKTESEHYWQKFLEKAKDWTDYFVNRFLLRTHCIRTGLSTGSNYDYSSLVLNGLFNEFASVVEETSDQEYSAFDSDKEISELYLWWIQKKHDDAQIRSQVQWFENKSKKQLLSEEEKTEFLELIQKQQKIQKEVFDEETKMLCRLIAIRHKLGY